MTDIKRFAIRSAEYGSAEYEGLRSLWCEVFGDPPAFVDAFYENFSGDITGYVMISEEGEVCSALTCHRCGTYCEKPVYVSYAVCTRSDMRGLGLASELISFVRDRVTEAGGLSLVSPAEASLVSFYEGLGYEPHFSAAVRAVMSPEFDMEEYDDFDEYDLDIGTADPTPFRAQIDLQEIPAEKYGRFREAFLSGQPHITPSDEMLSLMGDESMDGHGLYSVNRGDAICAVSQAGPVTVKVTELILNPVLKELSLDIDNEIASMIARYFGAAETMYVTPGYGLCQGMIYGMSRGGAEDAEEAEEERYYEEPYYGFPIN